MTAVAPKSRFLSLRWRLLAIFTLLFFIVLTGVFVWFLNYATDNAQADLEADLMAIAKTAAAGIDGDEHSALYSQGQIDDPTYLKINAYLREVKTTNPKASGIYTFVQLPNEPEQARFVVSAAIPPGQSATPREQELLTESAYGCTIRPDTRPVINANFTAAGGFTPDMARGLREPSIDPNPSTDQWGQWIAGAAPIYNAKGETVGAVGVDMCVAEVTAVRNRISQTLIPGFLIVTVLLAIAIYLIAHRLTKPIIGLTAVAKQISNGDYSSEVPESSSRLRDEVATLASVFAMMVDKVREREHKLRQQVAELQIIVDEGKRKQQVDEIVDSEFFRNLQEKAREARQRRDRRPPDPTS